MLFFFLNSHHHAVLWEALSHCLWRNDCSGWYLIKVRCLLDSEVCPRCSYCSSISVFWCLFPLKGRRMHGTSMWDLWSVALWDTCLKTSASYLTALLFVKDGLCPTLSRFQDQTSLVRGRKYEHEHILLSTVLVYFGWESCYVHLAACSKHSSFCI